MTGSQQPSSGKKRNYLYRKDRKRSNPKRGGPGILFSCETGRERKCENEGLDILEYYLPSKATTESSALTTEPKKGESSEEKESNLSLEDELKLLKSSSKATKGGNVNSSFEVYDTGCRGTVFVLGSLPGCAMIPPISKVDNQKQTSEKKDSEDEKGKDEDSKPSNEGDQSSDNDTKQPAKKPRIESEASKDDIKVDKQDPNDCTSDNGDSQPTTSNPWDPVETVRKVISDIESGCRTMPSSRFVLRMIPMQATCFASIEEIQATTQALIDKLFPQTAKSFAISAKRRNCENVNRDKIIDAVARVLQSSRPNCKVDLKNPDVTIVIEVCKTLCGISIIPEFQKFQNFNLVSIREKQEQKE